MGGRIISDYTVSCCEKTPILLLIFKIPNAKIKPDLKEGVTCDFGKALSPESSPGSLLALGTCLI